MKRQLAALAVILAVSLTLPACGHKGDSPDNSNPVGPGIPTVPPPDSGNQSPLPVNGTGLCAGKPTWQSADGTLKFCTLDTNLNLINDTCQFVQLGKTYYHTVGIVSATAGYFRSAAFASPENDCGATGDGTFNDPYDKKAFPAGESRFTFEWTFPENFCGRQQRDASAVNSTSRVGEVTHFVFNAPEPCKNCAAADLKLNERKTGARTYEITPTWKNGGTATLNWGDGTPDINGVRSGNAFSHTYGGLGPYTINLVVHQNGLECPDPITIRFDSGPTPSPTASPRPTPTPSPSSTPPNVCDGVGNPTFSMSKSEAATTATVTSALTFPGGFSGSITLSPNPISGFGGGAVTSGTANNSVYNRPQSNQSALTVNGNWEVRKGGKSCKTGSGSVTITPKPKQSTCDDFTAPAITLTPNVNTTATQVTVNSITANPSGGTFNPNPPQTYDRPSSGSSALTKTFVYTLQYNPAQGLTCTTRKSVDVRVPPREANCEQQNPPRGSITGAGGSGNSFAAGASVANAGDWDLQIRSASRESECNGNQPDYIKTHATATLQCGSSRNLNTSYTWAGHPSEWWWAALYRNGTLVERSGCVRNDRN